MANSRFTQFFYTKHAMPTFLDCNFIVDHTNGNGLGIRSLKGPGILDVFMNTSATPGQGNSGLTNPNPAAGYILVQLAENYNRYFCGFSGYGSPVSGTNIAILASGAALTPGAAYVITSVGTSTLADWQAIGVPQGVTPAVGVSFIAIATGAGTGSGQVQAPKTGFSGSSHIELIGDPNLSIAPFNATVGTAQPRGAWILSVNLAGSPLVATAPVDGTIINLDFYLSNSSANVVQGE